MHVRLLTGGGTIDRSAAQSPAASQALKSPDPQPGKGTVADGHSLEGAADRTGDQHEVSASQPLASQGPGEAATQAPAADKGAGPSSGEEAHVRRSARQTSGLSSHPRWLDGQVWTPVCAVLPSPTLAFRWQEAPQTGFFVLALRGDGG